MLDDLISAFTRLRPQRFAGEVRACELCGGSDHEVVGRRGRNGQRLRTVLCRGCGLVFTNPMPRQEEVDDYYRRRYREHYQGATVPRRKSILKSRDGAKGRLAVLSPLLTPRATVADVGAGSGEFVHEATVRGFHGIGIEPHRGFARYARDTYGIEMVNAGWERAAIAAGSVDMVTVNHVLEHLRHPLAALRTFHAWLKPGGHLFLSVPDIQDARRTPYGRFHFAHLYNFNHAALVMMARRAGFDVHPDFVLGPTTIVFRRRESPMEAWLTFPDNATVLGTFFRTYTNHRHFLSPTPYVRWVARVRRLGGQTFAGYATSIASRPQ